MAGEVRLKTILVSVILLLASTFSSQADFNKAVKAYQKGQFEDAISEFRVLAEQGDARAQKTLGDIYRKGRGVARDYQKSVQWYRLAATQGDPGAQMSLGSMYEKAWGVKQDLAEAMNWRLKAAEQGHAGAQFRLGYLYEHGKGIPQNFTEALKWYRLAAEQGMKGSKEAVSRVNDYIGSLDTQRHNKTEIAVHHGIRLEAFPPRSDINHDVKLVDAGVALAKLKRALDFIYRKSPRSLTAIETLKANGSILIFYDPSFEPPSDGLVIAVYLPEFYKDKDENGKKEFVVVVGTHGIKWPTEELAGVLVHELVGHGMQKYLGHMDYVRSLDLECTASLYEEQFYQDINRDKTTADAVQFRQALERHWCSDFKTFIQKSDPALLKTWDVMNPDVPKLLKSFDAYAETLKNSGVAQKAIQARKDRQKRKFQKRIEEAGSSGDREAQFSIGVSYLNGLGVEKNLQAANTWIGKAAAQGLAEAQAVLGNNFETGKGVAVDFGKAVAWYLKAAMQDNPMGQYNLARMYAMGKGVKRDYAKSYLWTTLVKTRHGGEFREKAKALQPQISAELDASRIVTLNRQAREWQPR